MRKVSILLGILALFTASSAEAATISLTGTIRDFNDSHPDFQRAVRGFDPDIVENALGVDGKPVYTGQAGNPTTDSQVAFDQWYRDVPGVNQSTDFTITLDNSITPDPNIYTFVDTSFFPIDNQLFGNQGRSHNYHFTYELHSQFTYQGGESFTFAGDDDLWVFINDRLVIDLGGIHTTLTESVNLDTIANSIGITPGNDYSLSLFFAERQTSGSRFRIDTSIILEEPTPVPDPSAVLPLLILGVYALYKRG
ncbi:MAG: fibro-slime domain-containing protein [Cyanobacteria bacterium P01_G01_bin.54]